MRKESASQTAQVAAAIRAYDNLTNQPPIFHDAYAINMTSPVWRFILSNKPFMQVLKTQPVRRAWDLLVTQVALRSAYSEDWLYEALDRGVKQYVMIGAGLDSFALRAGYYNESALKGARKYATIGAGFKYNIAKIDLSYLFSTSNVRNPLENTLRFSLTLNFGDKYPTY